MSDADNFTAVRGATPLHPQRGSAVLCVSPRTFFRIQLAQSQRACIEIMMEAIWVRSTDHATRLRVAGDTVTSARQADLFVTGRVDEMIISGGENVSPGEIESVRSRHLTVAEVAVADLPSGWDRG